MRYIPKIYSVVLYDGGMISPVLDSGQWTLDRAVLGLRMVMSLERAVQWSAVRYHPSYKHITIP